MGKEELGNGGTGEEREKERGELGSGGTGERGSGGEGGRGKGEGGRGKGEGGRGMRANTRSTEKPFEPSGGKWLIWCGKWDFSVQNPLLFLKDEKMVSEN